ncbi:DUF6893 family small protein [Nocardia sp. NPDC020380]
MEVVGVIATVIVALIVVALAAVGLLSIPDVKRYMRIRRM